MNSTAHASKDHTPDDGGSDYIPLYRFWQPRFWGLWIGLAALRLMVMLPYRTQLAIGRRLGLLAFAVAPRRRRIAEVNLRLCFPELDEPALQRLLRDHLGSLGCSVFEIGMALWAGDARVAGLVTFKGIDNLTTPLEQGHGVIVLSGHFAAVELTGRAARNHIPDMAAMYRPIKNPLIDQLLRRARWQAISTLIPKSGMRQMIRLLRNGRPVWYASDQSYDRAYAELVPFFGEPAMTNAALSHIARMGKARVVPFYPRRLADGSGFACEFLPALENFPGDDPAADAARVNTLLAQWVRQAPEQYYWVHRRFKNRPDPYPDPYRDV